MRQSQKSKRLDRWEVATLAMLGWLVVFGTSANGGALLALLGAFIFLGVMVCYAWMWRYTVESAKRAKPLTRGQTVWSAAVFVGFVAVVVIAWRFM